MNKIRSMSILALALALGACSSDAAPTTIVAATGGTVEIADRATRLEIPANSLPSDTTVTMRLEPVTGYPALADAVEVMVLEPQGTGLELGATVEWTAPVTLSGTERVSLSELVDGAWRTLERSTVIGSGGVVTTSVSRLGTYALVVSTPPAGPVEAITGTAYHLYTEEPLAGLAVDLLNGETVVASATSGTDGSFTFGEQPVGTYTARANIAAEMNCFSDPTEKTVTTTEGTPGSVSFGFVWPCE